MIKGIERLRQSIENQRDAGEGEFRLSFADIEAICAECEDEPARLSWTEDVPAPRDADGEVVPLTTKMMYDDDGEELTVRLICYRQSDGGWVVELCRPCAAVMNTLTKFHLSRPDSWKRLEEDVKQFENDGTACSYFGSELRSCDGCKSPGRIGSNCRDSVTSDILRRAKALAERDAKEAER